jgi:hypothetical protein
MISLTLTNQQVIEKDRALEEAGSINSAGQFAMNIGLNRFILDPLVKMLQKLQEPSQEFVKFNSELEKINKEFGNLKIDGSIQYYTLPDENIEAYNKKADPLKKKFKKAIDQREKQLLEYEETLKAPANGGEAVKLHQIPKELPDGLKGNTIFALMELVDLPKSD